jgi:DNA polymerase-3 subunit beta
MNIVLPRKHLRPLVAQAIAVAKATTVVKHPTPHHLVLDAAAGYLRVTADNLRWSITGSTRADGDGGSIAAPATMLLAAIDQLADGPIQIRATNVGLRIKTLGEAREIAIHGQDASRFPTPDAPPDVVPVRLPIEAMACLLTKTRCTMSQDRTRPHVNALMLDTKGDRLRAWSTNGHRCHMAEAVVSGIVLPRMLVPRGAVFKLRAMVEAARKRETAGHVDVRSDGKVGAFSVGGSTLVVRLVQAAFPPCEQVLPETPGTTVETPRRLLLKAIGAVEAMTTAETVLRVNGSGSNWQSRFTFDANTLRIYADGASGSIEDALPIVYSSPRYEVAYCAAYLVDALEVIDGENVRLEVNTGDTLAPLVIRSVGPLTSFAAIVMPVRP